MPYRLQDYPFTAVHARVGDVCGRHGVPFVDLAPVLAEHPDSELWVHPADQHPNELAHRIAGETLAGHLLSNRTIEQVLRKRNPRITRIDTEKLETTKKITTEAQRKE